MDHRGGVGGDWFGENISRRVEDGLDTYFWTDPWVDGTPLCERFGRLFELTEAKPCSVAEMALLGWGVSGEAWEWRRQLRAWEEEMLRECQTLLLNITLQIQTSDRWQWQPGPDEGYYVRGAYQLLTTQDSVTLDVAAGLIWHSQIPLKVSIFVWRLLRDRLPTKANLVTRGILSSEAQQCMSGCRAVESAHHLFLSCSTFGSIWSLVRNWIGSSPVIPHTFSDHFTQFTYSAVNNNGFTHFSIFSQPLLLQHGIIRHFDPLLILFRHRNCFFLSTVTVSFLHRNYFSFGDDAATSCSNGTSSDPSSPYYVHPGDGPSSVKVTPVLNGSNYHSWSRSMRRALGGKLKLDFIDGTIPIPLDSFDPSFRAWNRCNMLVHSWIVNSVSDSIAQSIIFMENAIDVWIDLKERFSQGDLVRISELQHEIYSLKQESRSVTEFYSDLKLLWEELKLYLPIPNCTCRQRCSCEAMRAARNNHTILYVIRFLTGLNENFAMVKSQILLMDPLPTLNKVFSMVIQHERQCGFAGSDESKIMINAARSKNFTSKPLTRVCTFCGKDNHIVDNCYKKYGLPPNLKNRVSANHATLDGGIDDSTAVHDPSSSSSTITQDQATQLIALLQNSFPNSTTASTSSNQVGSASFIGHPSVNQGTCSPLLKSCSLGNWILDSGVSHHICNSIQWYHSYNVITPVTIKLPNGQNEPEDDWFCCRWLVLPKIDRQDCACYSSLSFIHYTNYPC
ncbi:hypothetical protein TSUD_180420 [Trifolium subterraneum]|uniref:Reverse transcriptase zinc-binding domain-containing protein n=1 Tax=Trifolium subterraneum TaxID=3900 RepID=A0A2Z6P0K2_TRISU|nr:hypothetical protein TSUD_180420 [Trifolium subterraneum]